MTTRLYLTTAAASYTPGVYRATTWDDTTLGSTNTWKLSKVKEGTNTECAGTETSATNNWKVLLHRHVSEPLAGGSITGGSAAFRWNNGRLESTSTANMFVFLHMWVTVGDSDTVRFTYLANFLGVTEFPTTATIHSWTSAEPTAGTIQAGDRLIVEYGYSAANTSTAARTGTVWSGGTAADLATSGTTGITTDSPWIEWAGTGSDAALVPITQIDGSRPVTATLTATAAATHTIDGSRPVTATLTADATVTAPTVEIDGTLTTTANRTADATVTHTIDAAAPITATRTADATATHTVAGNQPLTATTTATATAAYAINGTLTATAIRTATAARTIPIDGILAITANRTADATNEILVTIDGSRPVTATLTATALPDHTIDGNQTVTTALVAAATATHTIDGELAVTTNRTATANYVTGTGAQMAATATLVATATVQAAYTPAHVVERATSTGSIETAAIIGTIG